VRATLPSDIRLATPIKAHEQYSCSPYMRIRILHKYGEINTKPTSKYLVEVIVVVFLRRYTRPEPYGAAAQVSGVDPRW
jgi:hypothetical protein